MHCKLTDRMFNFKYDYIDICQGKVKFLLPFTDEKLVLDIEDLENIKKMIME